MKNKPGASCLVIGGSTMKALDRSGRFGGYAIPFSTTESVDCVGDFFTAKTDLDLIDRSSLPMYFGHASDPVLGDRKLCRVSFKIDPRVGLWVEGQLDIRDRWLEGIWKLIADQQALGFSSSSTSHLVRRVARTSSAGKTVFELTAWPIAEISATPSPCSCSTSVVPLKSWRPSMSLDKLLQSHSVGGFSPFEIEREKTRRSMLRAQADDPVFTQQVGGWMSRQERVNLAGRLAFEKARTFQAAQRAWSR